MPGQHDTLRQQIGTGVVLTPGDVGYQQSLLRWSRAAVKPAHVVVQPSNADQVSCAVKYATTHKIPLVVMGGGHSTSGSSSSSGGMVIDLRRISSVKVDPARRTVTFGGGCLWKDVDEACSEHGLATVGGTVSHTGVGGLTLGGGYGWLSSKYGLTIDNLLSVEVVLANGNLVTASDTENQDLFWAIRGAGQNFGVATSFTSKAYPQGHVWAGNLFFTLDKMHKVLDFANWFHEHNTGNESLCFGVLGAAPGLPHPVLLCIVFKDGEQEEAEMFFKPLLDLGPLVNMAKMTPYKEANNLYPNRNEEKRRLLGGASFAMPLNVEFFRAVVNEYISFVAERNIGEGSSVTFEILPNSKIIEVAKDATAFPSRGDFYHAAIIFTWDEEAMDTEIRQLLLKVVGLFTERGFQGGGRQYSNYDGQDLEPSTDRTFGENLPRLQKLKRKYDPDNVFCRWRWPHADGNDYPL